MGLEGGKVREQKSQSRKITTERVQEAGTDRWLAGALGSRFLRKFVGRVASRCFAFRLLTFYH